VRKRPAPRVAAGWEEVKIRVASRQDAKRIMEVAGSLWLVPGHSRVSTKLHQLSAMI
jgi:hypothetical protein